MRTHSHRLYMQWENMVYNQNPNKILIKYQYFVSDTTLLHIQFNF